MSRIGLRVTINNITIIKQYEQRHHINNFSSYERETKVFFNILEPK